MNQDIDFTVLFDDDIIPTITSLSQEDTKLILYTSIDDKKADDLLKYYALATICPTRLANKNIQNPLRLPIEFYEYPDIAKALAPEQNKRILKVEVNMSIPQIYDEFNPFSKVKEHDQNVFIIRKKSKYNNSGFISYTLRNSNVITDYSGVAEPCNPLK